MHSFTLATLLAPAVLAANMQVIVGANNQLTFTPNTLTAQPGDTVQFMFAFQNHTVTSGVPGQGCVPSGQFFSGFVPAPGVAPAAPAASAAAGAGGKAGKAGGAAGAKAQGGNGRWSIDKRAGLPSFTVPIRDTKPITIYCSAAQHCQSGMVMVINPTQQGATSLVAYQQVCAKAKINGVPKTGPTGGQLANLLRTTPATGAGAGTAKGQGQKGAGAGAGAAKGCGQKGAAAGAGVGQQKGAGQAKGWWRGQGRWNN
ncbi:hypothetical protein EJ06DRAFT_557717 [Trichodelitschia bisporula]|uniref:Cupredoxin n=1 Tax=Trichodelitschia bisporula TaxID=703511 RepID=A0A6G1HU35_9PEZI|nr:hypothetical protein EJ06DRAFT_557717 [Trichodelitschia bisporula]